MQPIIQLDPQLINKIAAGEVVERPLSVVKELTENAIDARASVITVEIRDGGLATIRVTDNGSGISPGQLPLAFARHATSKIAVADDLFDVRTLGFRGEALCSIAAVAQVEMITKTPDEVMGMRVEVHGGQTVTNQPIGCTNGTTVVVSNLFYNVPARRKFLKKPSTEAAYVSDCIERLALSHPDLSFRYINSGQLMLQTSGKGDLKTTILQVYGRETASKMLTVEKISGDLQLNGYIGKPETTRGNRQYGNFFINGRYIKSKLLQQAVEAAMKTMLPTGRFPVYVLRLTIPPQAVDVNVHPTKMDVRFAEEELVSEFVREAVFGTLTDNSLIPLVRLGKKMSAEDEPDFEEITLPDEIIADASASCETGHRATRTIPMSKEKATSLPVDTNENCGVISKKHEKATLSPADVISYSHNNATTAHPLSSEKKLTLQEEPQPPKVPFFRDYHIQGLLFGTYWLISQGESLYLIDQHAAHERVLYDEITQGIQQADVPSQPLLEPVILRLTAKEAQRLHDHRALFNKFGFIITDSNLPAITAVPFILKGPLSAVLVTDLLDKLEHTGESPELKENAVAMMACKAAVKAHDALSDTEARALIKKMLELENPFTCPHGRPTIIEITKKEIERKFKRV